MMGLVNVLKLNYLRLVLELYDLTNTYESIAYSKQFFFNCFLLLFLTSVVFSDG